ncbi:cell division FtsK/SpoIIIE [Emticicia oligotrophica DSM 17448]|uniref:Cell division FtsK/SpoIIIE n=1 Tax=Emticicia oligotrophica (strain DSM 17448 / CIP 109782 / MTCC 6937 / GPTSA100-15) TaxID=929562 RepID=A0ABM5MYK9_EMTOG|nr:DNA translocase FtsK [Emticicia oligotrophica]AFK02256.1 cell division FtsK/SpoIIIE [Emticicia oligotrophica DSM 17448]
MPDNSNSFRKKQPPKANTGSSKGNPSSSKAGGNQVPIDFNFNKENYQLALGIFLLALSLILFLSFVSYLFTGDADQDVVQRTFWDSIKNADKKAQNIIGLLGAKLSHYFIFEWFGLAAFGWVPVLTWAGYRLVSKKDLLPYNFNRFTISSIFYIFWTSIFIGYFVWVFDLQGGTLCGGLGYAVNHFFQQAIGWGGIVVILVILAGWLIFFHGFTQFDDWFFAKYFKKDSSEEEDDISTERIRKAVQVDIEDELEKTDNSFRKATPPSPVPIIDEANSITLETEQPKVKQEDIIVPKPFEEVTFEIEDKTKEKSTLPNEPFKGGPTFIIENIPEPAPPTDTFGGDLDDDDINEKVLKDFGLFDPTLDLGNYQYPPITLLSEYGNTGTKVTEEELEANKNNIVETMRNFQIGISSIKATIGPTVTLYEIVPEAGIRISKIKNLEDDIALNLAALGIRIIAPMPGKGTVGIEVPNKNREMVTMKSVIASDKFQKTNFDLPIILGKTISNEIFVTDLAKMPHLLMAGATGQGKSVGLNVILASLLYKKHPAQIKFVLVDPKKVELTLYNKIERHFLAMLPNAEEAIITDTKKVVYTLNSLCIEMDNRYNLLKDAGVRNLKEYNAKFVQRRLNPDKGHRYLPYIVLVIDELADLMMTAGKEVEQPIARLAQLARAIGIHLIVATQRPSVNVITGLIKANFPARLSFKVTSKIDSRTILDTGGSEQLVGNGDMLLSMGSDMVRLQCPFVDTPEVEEICEFIGSQRAYDSAYMLPEFYGDEDNETVEFDASELDPMFEDAARLIVTHQQGSTSLIQRKMKLGYNRAGRIIDQLEGAGIVGPFEGSKAREVLVKDLEHLDEILRRLR